MGSLLLFGKLFFYRLRKQIVAPSLHTSTMAFAQCFAAPIEHSAKFSHFPSSVPTPCSLTSLPSYLAPFSSFKASADKFSLFARPRRIGRHGIANAQPQDSETTAAADAFTHFKHLLLPITDRNPYLSEGTRQAAATTAALAKKYGADITVVVIDEQQKESLPEHQTQLASIRWHLSEGGFQEFKLLERLGEGSKPTAIIGEVADDMSLDLVVLSMEAIHSKHVDANLLAEFIPCPVLLLPL